MHLLFLILNETEYLDDILAEFLEIGIKGATILDSQGMGRALSNNSDIPIFGSLRSVLNSSKPYNKTVFSVIENEELLNKAVNAINEIVGDICKPGVGLMFTIPITNVCGLPKKTNK